MATTHGWRERSPVEMSCEKTPAHGRGIVVTNHPLGTAAGVKMLTSGGNAVDAAVASLFCLTVVEPMMVGIAGGGLSHLRLAGGRHLVVDALSTAPGEARAEMFDPVSDEPGRLMETVGERNRRGPGAVAVPGNLVGWCSMHERFGKLPLADILAPAIRHAARGFEVTPYLSGAIAESAETLASDPAMAVVMMPGGDVPAAGERMVQGDYAESLRLIARQGAAALHGGALGEALIRRIRADADPGTLSPEDLRRYTAIDRDAVVGSYRGYEIAGPPPPASSGVHVAQMLNIAEGFDVRGLGFGTPAALHLQAEILKIGFADRRKSSGDPAFLDIPVGHLMSKSYAEECRRGMDMTRAAVAALPAASGESRDTTHVTIADADGNVVAATHTINGLFGARFMVPEAGFIPNNYMSNFDPHPGRALSIAPDKRVPTSMAPLILRREGRPCFALGLPGGLRIFPSAFQTVLNLIDHGMTLQEAVEAPRLWTEGAEVEIEPGYAAGEAPLAAAGHRVKPVPHIGGGMNAIAFHGDGSMTGAACWRSDGTVAALGGGLARPGVRFWPGRSEAVRR